MKYLLLICGDLSAYEAMQADESFDADCADWTARMREADALRLVEGLHPPDDATTVRVRGGDVLLGDGPFAETKEVIAGMAVLEFGSRQEALNAAAAHPVARYGTLELRQIR